jgi:hypothetical protein
MPAELIANTPTPGTAAVLTTLAAAITTTGATTITSNAAALAALQGGQFRILIDTEYMLVTAGQSGTSWTVTRGVEGSTAATHLINASIYHIWTAVGLLGAVAGVIIPSGDTSGATDLAAFTAAAATNFRQLGKGTFYINGYVNLMGFMGQGSDLSFPLTDIVCVGASSGVIFQGISGVQTGGLVSGGFRIQGSNVATRPLLIGGTTNAQAMAQCTFINVDVVNSALDNWLVQGTQNALFLGCNSQSAARDNLTLDLGCGGLDFVRFESDLAARYALRVTQSGTSPSLAYAVPQDIMFHSGEFETGSGGAAVNLEYGQDILFHHLYIEVPVATYPAINIASTFGGTVEIASGFLQNDGSSPTIAAVVPAGSGGVFFTGKVTVVGFPAMVDNTANVPVSIAPGAYNGVGTAFKSGTGDETSNAYQDWTTAAKTYDSAASVVEYGKVSTDAGQRYRRYGDGSIAWNYGGSGYSFPALLAPRSDGNVGLSVGSYAEFLSASGLTGATAASRYVGGTASGAPVSGTFAVGDFVVDQTGKVWVCTTAPGTWTQAGGGGGGSQGTEIGYDQITSPVTISSTTEASGTTIISCGSHAFDGAAVMGEFFSPGLYNASNGGQVFVCLFEASVEIGELTSTYGPPMTNPARGSLRFTPTAGSHTYTVTAYTVSSGGSIVDCGAGGTGAKVPAYMRFTKV